MQKEQKKLTERTIEKECSIFMTCGGCPYYQLPYPRREEQKKQSIREFLSQNQLSLPVAITHLGFFGLRDRFDLQYQNGVFGLYAQGSQDIVAMPRCPKIHPILNQALQWLNAHPLPIERAALRLRRSPQKKVGLWIDASHPTVHQLMTEQTWLTQASKQFLIEIGQKHKRLIRKTSKWGLHKHPQLEPWFETPISTEKKTPLYTTIAGFTQPSMRINTELVLYVQGLVHAISAQHWLEYGCGAGNFSFMLSQNCETLDLIEISPLAKKGLQKGLSHLPNHAQIQFLTSCSESSCTAILVDPPRSGMGTNLSSIYQHPTIRDIIYVSCNIQSLIHDMRIVFEHGYELRSIHGVNQFPRSTHCEWIAHLSKSKS